MGLFICLVFLVVVYLQSKIEVMNINKLFHRHKYRETAEHMHWLMYTADESIEWRKKYYGWFRFRVCECGKVQEKKYVLYLEK